MERRGVAGRCRAGPGGAVLDSAKQGKALLVFDLKKKLVFCIKVL